MKISILLPDMRGGGAERLSLVLAREFSRDGHEVEFVLMQASGALLEETKVEFNVAELRAKRARAVPLSLARYLRRSRPDALFVAIWPLTVIAPLGLWLSRHKCSVLISEHNALSVQYGDWGWLHRLIMRASMVIGYRLADFRVAVSSGVAADIAALSWMKTDRINVIHNPVPPRTKPDRISVQRAEELWSCPKSARIVTVGSMKPQKNHPLLLRAFARIKKPEARLMFVGDGPRREFLMELARELGVEDRVIFAGFHSDPTPFYFTANLFVLSSNYEGFGNVIVEAMACGLPVVSTDCPFGPSEILKEGRYGRLVKVRDDIALAEAINDELKYPTNSNDLMHRSKDFTPEISAKKYIQLVSGSKKNIYITNNNRTRKSSRF